jgi:hypothetical protein
MPDTFHVEVETAYLKYDINHHEFLKNIEAELPAFEKFRKEPFDVDSTRRRLYAWIVIMYDINTPLRREVKDLYKRKVYAGNLCGITPNVQSGKYKGCFEDIFVGKDKAVNDLIVKFITSFSSPEYTQLIANVTIQADMLEKIISRKADTKVQTMFDLATKQIKELTNIIYGSGERDEVYEARRALYKQVAYDLSDMRAEAVARMYVKDGKFPDEWNPYEAGYQPDEMHFVGDDPSVAKDSEEALP